MATFRTKRAATTPTRTIYHELGHIYYYLYYKNQPFLFQSGAHDGFHEAIGDALTLSMTLSYYERVDLTGKPVMNPKALTNQQLVSHVRPTCGTP